MKLADIQLIYNKNFDKTNTEKILNAIEKFLSQKEIDHQILKDFLRISRKPSFLRALGSDAKRIQWAELTFKIIRKINFTFHDLFMQRLQEHPKKSLFLEKTLRRYRKWSYEQIYNRIKETAAFFWYHSQKRPKVLIFMENSIDTAIIDLAALMFDIFDTPLNVYSNVDILKYVIEELEFDFIMVDTKERAIKARKAIENINKKILIGTTNAKTFSEVEVDFYLPRESKGFTKSQIDNILENRERIPLNGVATTMFTSGSTGMPKGVSFSIYNIVSKRFARAASLPDVGENEIFVCYLPLYHTFGRYLEMTGLIFWGGTYVMANNPSFDTLSKMFTEINPTGFISVPIRWQQFYDKINSKLKGNEPDEIVKTRIREVVGNRLFWGLSAAGYLEPKVFRFFHKYGISLNSGFGMTEATGGITMTPPFKYIENSVGIPLPGMQTRLSNIGELELKSHYLARYVEQAKPGDTIPYPEEDDYWLKTGDIFKIDENGYHYIIDRVKDIYKNNKGQTIAPRLIESKFEGVPGIKRVFLVGDGRPYNVLLIVPNKEDLIWQNLKKDEQNRYEYFRQIILAANKDLAPYERVINFAVIDRDFSIDKGELTPKGSYRRKNIEKNFSKLIQRLYQSDVVKFSNKNLTVLLPRWLIRDIGVLENDFELSGYFLVNKVSGKKLKIAKCKKENFIIVGDLAYALNNNQIDLGLVIRQPKLWIANPSLLEFMKPKVTFELPMKNFSSQICLPEKRNIYPVSKIPVITNIKDETLILLNNILSIILHTEDNIAIEYLNQLEVLINDFDKIKLEITARRLEALACHPNERIRSYAYSILVTMAPDIDYSKFLPSFISYGKTFLSEETINKIASSPLNLKQLQALRQRMHAYRQGLKWPANKNTREQFAKIFQLFVRFGKNNPTYYRAIRAELACWGLFEKDSKLAQKARQAFNNLSKNYEEYIESISKLPKNNQWNEFFLFDEGIDEQLQEIIKKYLAQNHFLKISIYLTYDNYDFDYSDLKAKSIRVSLLKSYSDTKHFRISINSSKGEHFDIHFAMGPKVSQKERISTIHRHIALSDLPDNQSIMAEFGYVIVDKNIYSSRYISQLSAWDKIRSMAEIQKIGYIQEPNFWRKLFIRSMSIFFKAWDYSGQSILPGRIDPDNVVVPEVDFSENVKILSLSKSQTNGNISSLIYALYKNFYLKTQAHYPSLGSNIKITWLFHSIKEALGTNNALKLIKEFISELEK